MGHDSGPLHLASISGVPWIGLYSARNPARRWHPYLGDGKVFQAQRAIAELAPDEIAEYAARMLAL
jgi:ADP-heptose:LPS heptosyltransferase